MADTVMWLRQRDSVTDVGVGGPVQGQHLQFGVGRMGNGGNHTGVFTLHFNSSLQSIFFSVPCPSSQTLQQRLFTCTHRYTHTLSLSLSPNYLSQS